MALRALRDAQNILDIKARIGAVSVHLGMIEDAKKLFSESKRHDLLNNLLQVGSFFVRRSGYFVWTILKGKALHKILALLSK